MKTKHLFFAAALAASFTACTNDDIIEVQQQGVATVERPTVENVQLNFIGEGAESRLTFGANGYAWETTDTIGALLMDTPNDISSENWANKYALTSHINTSYPFTYAEGNWSTPGKMLEGNYFFAFPWSSYDGGRYVKHSLLTQAQKGIASDVVAKSLAANQLFIGYSQIKGGSAFDVLTDVEMTSVLGALQLRIKNTSDKTYHINKIVVSGSGVLSELTFDPAWGAVYGGTAVGEDEPSGLEFTFKRNQYQANQFNYANYVGDTEALFGVWTSGANPGDDDVYTESSIYDITEENAKYYNRADALRAVVQRGSNVRNVAYLNVEGTESERALASGKTAYALIMVNPLTSVSGVTVSMYTDEGLVELIDDLGSEYNLSNELVEKVLPGVSNTVSVEFDEEDVAELDDNFNVYTEEDLALFVDWNKSATGSRTAVLNADIKLTKEIFNAMKAATKVTWNLYGNKKLILSEELPADALDYTKLLIDNSLEIVAEGTVNFTAATSKKNFDALTIAEGAVMNIKVAVDNDEISLPAITNKGTLNIAAVQVLGAGVITNDAKGTINVAAGADVKGAADLTDDNNDETDENMALINNGIVNNAGYMQYIKNNAGAVINLTGSAVLKNLTNAAADVAKKLAEGKVNAAAGTSVGGTNAGLIACADNTVSVTATGGKIALEVTGSIAKDTYKDTKINTLIIKGATTFANIQTGIANIITTDGSELKLGAAAFSLSLTSLEVNGATTITTVLSGDNANKVSVANLTINKGATLTNNGNIEVTTAFSNEEGKVVNNQTANLPSGSDKGNWLYNDPGTYTPNAVIKWIMTLGGADEDTDAVTKTRTNLYKLYSLYDTNDEVTSLTINSNLDMATAVNGSNTNAAYDAVLEKAKIVYLNANITNMKEGYATTANKFVVSGNATISGSDNMTLIKVDELVVNANKTLTISNGYLQINVTAVEGKGCEEMTINGTVSGIIVATNAASELLYWDVTNKVWTKTKPTTSSN